MDARRTKKLGSGQAHTGLDAIERLGPPIVLAAVLVAFVLGRIEVKDWCKCW